MKPMIFNATLYDVRVKRNGGRLQLDFGLDALSVIQELVEVGAMKDQNFQFAVVQVDPDGITEPEDPVDFDLENES